MKTHEELDQYVATGIVEAYVLGILNATEAQEFEKKITVHPELKQQLHDAEKLLKPLIKPAAVSSGRLVGDTKHFVIADQDDEYRRKWNDYRMRQQRVNLLNKKFRLALRIAVILSVLYIIGTLFFFILWKKA